MEATVVNTALEQEEENRRNLRTPLLNEEEVLWASRRYWPIKRGLDVTLSLLALIVLSPLMLLIALIIYLDDPKGSPIFTQVRCGRKGKEFKFYKFRTMYVNAESLLEELLKKNEMDGPVFKIKDDPRITRVGKILRKSGLDELPQLINIVKGDMSIIGPRPALPREVAQYDAYHAQRLYVQPGLSCYWQICPNRNSLSFDEWLELDLKYIRERSFLTDVHIIFSTLATIIHLEGE